MSTTYQDKTGIKINDFTKYLNDDKSLNNGKLWSDVANIRGFFRVQQREDLYNAVKTWHNMLYLPRKK